MKKNSTKKHIKVHLFQKHVLNFYRTQGKQYSWRMTHAPYHILVSELMLQQTQTDRVAGKFQQFIETFPTVQKLVEAEVSCLLLIWKGLGYNRRVLPGIGEYTSKAVSVFAFNQPEILLDTNIRSVNIHHIFPGKDKISDTELVPLVKLILYKKILEPGILP